MNETLTVLLSAAIGAGALQILVSGLKSVGAWAKSRTPEGRMNALLTARDAEAASFVKVIEGLKRSVSEIAADRDRLRDEHADEVEGLHEEIEVLRDRVAELTQEVADLKN